MQSLRLLQFDASHPRTYLIGKQLEEGARLAELDYRQYYEWLMSLRVGLSDYLTHYMSEAGWEARQIIAHDALLLEKLIQAGEIPGSPISLSAGAALRHVAGLRLADLLRGCWSGGFAKRKMEWLLENYIGKFQPDVIFLREPCHVDGKFWDRFRDKCVIASFIACNTNHATNWDPHRSDIIFTLTPEYEQFFKAQGIPSHVLEYGVDERVFGQVQELPKAHDVTFVGYLGQPTQSAKTELMSHIAERGCFKWWGVRGTALARYPALAAAWQGETSGIDMLRIYRQSRIVLNDYVDMAVGRNVNLRTKEVMSVGTMLLTRRATNIKPLEDEGALATFSDAEECLRKISHFLANEQEREAIAEKGLRIGLRDYNYRDIGGRVMAEIRELYAKKKSSLHAWR